MSFDLTNKNISDTFQNLLQKTGSEGHLYDLTGNKVDNLTIGGTLTAHSYVTSESIVNTSSGSTAFGNTIDDSHTFIGHITASGNISSSGRIDSKDGFFKDGVEVTGGGGGSDNLGDHIATQDLDMSTWDIKGVTHITASGNISASSLEVNSVNATDDFFLLKSGSLTALKLNNEGVLQLGGFTFDPTPVPGGIYYHDTDNEFYLGKKDS